MDFSAAQRAAHAEEYAETMMLLFHAYPKLSPEAHSAQRRTYVEEASAFLQGCEVHFWRSGTRVAKNAALVPLKSRSRFDQLLRELLSPLSTEDQFGSAVHALNAEFPALQNWIAWWLQPLVARMIFPVRKTMSEDDARQLPHTSNPVETQHALLHHAVGKGHDLQTGIKALFLHCVEMEKRYQAVQGMLCLASVMSIKFL